MLQPRFRWMYPDRAPVAPALASAVAARGIPGRIAELLQRRGCRDAADLARFVGPAGAGLHDPALLPAAAIAAERLAVARRRGERVMVLGDFDADGLTGLAVLVRALRGVGVSGRAYVPDRISEGHGLSRRAVNEAEASGCALIVTVDCGTSSPAEVDLARAAGIDVIVTDHHHVPAVAANPLALVNPMVVGSPYPDPRLTGAGVAFKVAQLILDGAAFDPLDLSDLASVGTIADVGLLLGENRSIVRLGLERMRTLPRPAMVALLQAAGMPPERVDADAMGYVIAPRLNAAGRVGNVRTAARLLMTDDPAEAAALAGEMESWNVDRRGLTARALAEALEAAEAASSDAAVVVAGPWPVGVIGLVAGRIAESTNRPAVVFSTSVDPWRGSARATSIDLAATFGACAEHFVRFGGHARAAGCDLAPGAFDAFRDRFVSLVAAAPAPGAPTLALDLVIAAEDLDYPLLEGLRLLEPTGAGNPAPVLCVEGIVVSRVRAVNAGHLQLTLAKGREVIDGIAFGRSDLAETLTPASRVDLVGRLSSRSFRGIESLQFEVLDIAPPAGVVIHGEPDRQSCPGSAAVARAES
jgi:single-stranded-DNA-specific exonuclease